MDQDHEQSAGPSCPLELRWPGLRLSTVAYNVYIASLLGFVLQVEKLPDAWERAEASVTRRLVPGPVDPSG